MRSKERCWRRLFAGKSAPLKGGVARSAARSLASATSMCARRCIAPAVAAAAAGTLARSNGAPTSARGPPREAITAVLNEAVEAGGSSLRDHRQTDGNTWLFSAPVPRL